MFLALWYHGQLSLPRKTVTNHQAYQFFFSFTRKSQGKLKFSHVDLTSTWVGKGRMLPATLMTVFNTPWFSCHLEHLWENLWQPNTIWFSYFSLSTGDTFSQLFSFSVCENGTFSEWVSHNNEKRTKKLIQDIRMHLWTLCSHYYWMPLNIAT